MKLYPAVDELDMTRKVPDVEKISESCPHSLSKNVKFLVSAYNGSVDQRQPVYSN